MAEVAKNVVRDSLAEEDDGCHIEPPEEISLQELIDTELALRVPLSSTPVKQNQCFINDFLEAERELSSAALDNNRPSSPIPTARFDVFTLNEKNGCCPPPQMNGDLKEHLVDNGQLNILEPDEVDQGNDWTTVEVVAREIVGLDEIKEVDPCNDEVHVNNVSEEHDSDVEHVISKVVHVTKIEHVVNHVEHVINHVEHIISKEEHVISKEEPMGNGHAYCDEDELYEQLNMNTSTEYIESCNAVLETTPSSIENSSLLQTSTSTIDSETKTPVTETSVTDKKKKKKTATENGEVTVTKSKKTKKSKKTEEKENHISVTRSFGDIHKACEHSDLTGCNKYDTWRAQSLGDLTRIDKHPVITGVNVKQLKSSFSKFDQLSKKVLHVRSSDPAKASKTFNQSGSDGSGTSTCKSCNKTVFAMEQIKAERAVYHKNCFRCHTCNKQLTVDIYSSHEGELYCKPHFKELFKPKVIVDDEEPASDKPDLGLEELSSLNVKSRFQVFEKQDTPDANLEKSPTTISVKRSSSILSKLAKFQKKGMDVGVSDEALNGFVYNESETSEEEEDEDEEEEKGIIKCRRKTKEMPVSFTKIDDVKKSWESQQDLMTRREEMREQRKEELQQIRSRLFMGKQGKMKELYEQAVAESEGKTGKKELENDIIKSEKARVVREKFEKGETINSDDETGGGGGGAGNKNKGVEEDMSVFEEGISKKSRSIFLEMDANAVKTQQTSPPATAAVVPVRESMAIKKGREVYYSRQASEDVVRSSDVVEDVTIQTADLSSKFKFFETYKAPQKERKAFRITPPREGQVKSESPEREVYRDPDVVRADDKLDDEQTVRKSQTTSRMLSMFRQLEEQKEVVPEGLKPKKCFTPPPDYKGGSCSEEETDEDEEEEDEDDEEEGEEDSEGADGVVKSSYKVKDEFLEKARNADRAKQLAAKFESWEPEKQSNNNAITMLDSEHASIDSTKSLRAKFESLKTDQPKEKARPKVNRFVESACPTLCAFCTNKVYPVEKVETNGKMYHKACFRCSYCNCILRMDSYTLNNDQLYCLPHYKQLFITKGNYDEGFGSDQHKRKWDSHATTTAC